MSTKNDRLQIVMKPVTAITAYQHNARHNDRTAMQLRKSIEAFGFKNPIVLDEHDTIVSGHARLKAAMMLGMTEVPCVYATGLTEDEIRAFRIADNKTAELAGWDYDKLCEEMMALQNEAFNLDLSGFSETEQYFYSQPELKPEPVDRHEYRDLQEDADKNVLQAWNVAIYCHGEEEKESCKQLIGETRPSLKRLYHVSEIREMLNTHD